MKQIRFKNDYVKLPMGWNGTQGRLICCYPETLTRLKQGLTLFFENDTKIRDRGDNIFYPIRHEDLLILVFIHYNTGTLIHTLRHNTEENFELFMNSIGKTFEFIHS